MKKLTEEEFKEIKEMQENFQNAKLTLGDLEITKKSVLDQVGDMKVQFAQIESSLIEKYGADSVIDMSTGEIKEKDVQTV
jgi:hypothetical protein|tara:strand:- start:347 stop:586 length:240 start_codon:yes stop_codon:yes gene_type:complete